MQIKAAMTLIIWDDLNFDILPSTVIGGTEFKLQRGAIDLFKGALDALSNKIALGEVIGEWLELKQKEGEPSGNSD